MADLSHPYVLSSYNVDTITLSLSFYGCIIANRVVVLGFDELPISREPSMNDANSTSILFEKQNVDCYWKNLTDNSLMIKTDQYKSPYIVTVFSADDNWAHQTDPDPDLPPQTHLVNLKTISDYYVNNGNYQIYSNMYSNIYMLISDGRYLEIDCFVCYEVLTSPPIFLSDSNVSFNISYYVNEHFEKLGSADSYLSITFNYPEVGITFDALYCNKLMHNNCQLNEFDCTSSAFDNKSSQVVCKSKRSRFRNLVEVFNSALLMLKDKNTSLSILGLVVNSRGKPLLKNSNCLFNFMDSLSRQSVYKLYNNDKIIEFNKKSNLLYGVKVRMGKSLNTTLKSLKVFIGSTSISFDQEDLLSFREKIININDRVGVASHTNYNIVGTLLQVNTILQNDSSFAERCFLIESSFPIEATDEELQNTNFEIVTSVSQVISETESDQQQSNSTINTINMDQDENQILLYSIIFLVVVFASLCVVIIVCFLMKNKKVNYGLPIQVTDIELKPQYSNVDVNGN